MDCMLTSHHNKLSDNIAQDFQNTIGNGTPMWIAKWQNHIYWMHLAFNHTLLRFVALGSTPNAWHRNRPKIFSDANDSSLNQCSLALSSAYASRQPALCMH